MSYFINNQQKMHDIIFAKRNKNYGAYAIRSAYGETVLKSVAYVALCFGTLMAGIYYLSHMNDLPEKPNFKMNPFQKLDSIYSIPIDLEKGKFKTPDSPREKAKSNPEVNAAANPTPVVRDSVPPANGSLNSSLAVTNPSATSGTDGSIIPTTGGGNGTLHATGGNSTVTNAIIESFVDTAPEPGCNITQFIKTHLKYPIEAISVEKGGTVYIQFIVDEEGKIQNPTSVTKLGFGLEEEGLRVVNMIPTFKKPAYKNGIAVKTYYYVPITYKIR